MPRKRSYVIRAPTLSDAGTGILVIGPWGFNSELSETWLNSYMSKLPPHIPVRTIARISGVALRVAKNNEINVLYTEDALRHKLELIKGQFFDCAVVLYWAAWSNNSFGYKWLSYYMTHWRVNAKRPVFILNSYCKNYCYFTGDPDTEHKELNAYMRNGYCSRHLRRCW